MSDVVILGSETPAPNFLVYQKGLTYSFGNYAMLIDGELELAGMNLDGEDAQAVYEFVGEAQ